VVHQGTSLSSSSLSRARPTAFCYQISRDFIGSRRRRDAVDVTAGPPSCCRCSSSLQAQGRVLEFKPVRFDGGLDDLPVVAESFETWQDSGVALSLELEQEVVSAEENVTVVEKVRPYFRGIGYRDSTAVKFDFLIIDSICRKIPIRAISSGTVLQKSRRLSPPVWQRSR